MRSLISEKLDQAKGLVKESGVDVWLTFVRETAEGGDPVLPLLIEGGLTWQSALMVTREGRCIAIVGNYDADPLVASGNWDEVVPYVQGIRQPLLEVLERVCRPNPKIAVNYSMDDVKSDGLSHGMFLLLQDTLRGTRFEGSLVSAESIAGNLRAQKSEGEVARIRAAISETESIFSDVSRWARKGVTEREVYDRIQEAIDAKGLGYAWDRAGDPIVNSGPDSMIGHGIPSASIQIAEGHIFHIDLGVIKEGYSSDIQRSWYVGPSIPEDVSRAFDAVHGAISAGAALLKPGVQGWEVDVAARSFLVNAGYEEYLHAFGHQVGRMAHDGGAILGPNWERYGKTPTIPIRENEVYTLELGVIIPGRGYLGLEEMAIVTSTGCSFLAKRQDEIWMLE